MIRNVCIGVLVVTLSGCASLSEPAKQPMDLSGDWEYQDDAATRTISLDPNGNGRYAWQGGHLTTTFFSPDRWEGHWYQEGNNREGEFALRPSSDGNEAEGSWWYTRIGEKEIPSGEQGGHFRLRRLSAQPSGFSRPAAGP